MELAFLIYGISVLDKLGGMLLVIGAILSFCSLFFLMNYEDGEDFKPIKRLIISTLAVCFIVVLIPSQKTMYTMTAAYTAQKVAESSEAKVIYEKVLKVVNTKLDEAIAEGKEGKK